MSCFRGLQYKKRREYDIGSWEYNKAQAISEYQKGKGLKLGIRPSNSLISTLNGPGDASAPNRFMYMGMPYIERVPSKGSTPTPSSATCSSSLSSTLGSSCVNDLCLASRLELIWSVMSFKSFECESSKSPSSVISRTMLLIHFFSYVFQKSRRSPTATSPVPRCASLSYNAFYRYVKLSLSGEAAPYRKRRTSFWERWSTRGSNPGSIWRHIPQA